MRWRDIVPIGELIFSLKVIELNQGVPLAVPHLLTTDDAYKGYRLPAGSIVIPNAWLVINTLNIVVHDRRSSGNQGHASWWNCLPRPIWIQAWKVHERWPAKPSCERPRPCRLRFWTTVGPLLIIVNLNIYWGLLQCMPWTLYGIRIRLDCHCFAYCSVWHQEGSGWGWGNYRALPGVFIFVGGVSHRSILFDLVFSCEWFAGCQCHSSVPSSPDLSKPRPWFSLLLISNSKAPFGNASRVEVG